MRKIEDMIRHQNPLMLRPTATVKHACECMRDRNVGAVLVTDSHRHLLGIFTGRDAVCRVLAQGKSAADTTLENMMTHNPDTISPEQTAIEALRLMCFGGFRHIPVVGNGMVVGIVSSGDFRGVEQDRLDEETGFWERL
jgi:CBS domain-containing protein